ncbi:hypothetical protein N7448_004062 [Penicillium atrosanguineum]|nr:hypothetical protein N7448_004062 [Penicillium atrosanguineum]
MHLKLIALTASLVASLSLAAPVEYSVQVADADSTVGQAFYDKYKEAHKRGEAEEDSAVGQAFYGKYTEQRKREDAKEDSAVGQAFYGKYKEERKREDAEEDSAVGQAFYGKYTETPLACGLNSRVRDHPQGSLIINS